MKAKCRIVSDRPFAAYAVRVAPDPTSHRYRVVAFGYTTPDRVLPPIEMASWHVEEKHLDATIQAAYDLLEQYHVRALKAADITAAWEGIESPDLPIER